MSETAKLTIDGKDYELPVITGTENEKAVDIGKLRGESGAITMDPGYGNTGACFSAITFLDGEKGILKYRGVPIEDLAEKSTFSEVSYLLLNGSLPTQAQLDEFNGAIAANSKLPEGIVNMIKLFPKDAHPMGVISAMTDALSAYNQDLLDQDLTEDQKKRIIPQLMGQLKTIATTFYQHTQSGTATPDSKLDYTSDFLNMMFNTVDPEVAKALDVLLILHADHEQNCSASTVRMVGSSKANLYTTVSAGCAALWGPSHGGANQAVIEMLDEIQADGGDYKKFLDKAKDKEDPFKLMGFGHRVYKNFDPRAKIIKKACDTILRKLGVNDPLLNIAKGLEEEALKDPYFVERKLYPNVDFYSGIIYRALGIPTNMFTTMFVLGRLPGWISQWKEMVEDGGMRICRPRQIYTGETNLPYTDITSR